MTRLLCFWNSYWTNPKYQFVFSTSSKFTFKRPKSFWNNETAFSLKDYPLIHFRIKIFCCFSFQCLPFTPYGEVFIFNINSVDGALPCVCHGRGEGYHRISCRLLFLSPLSYPREALKSYRESVTKLSSILYTLTHTSIFHLFPSERYETHSLSSSLQDKHHITLDRSRTKKVIPINIYIKNIREVTTRSCTLNRRLCRISDRTWWRSLIRRHYVNKWHWNFEIDHCNVHLGTRL